MNRCVVCNSTLPALARYKNGKWPLRCDDCRAAVAPAQPQFHQPTTLYRLWDGAGALLYIGVAGNPGRRFEQHHGDKAWWPDVSTITLEHHSTRRSAQRAESAAIAAEAPLFNVALRTGCSPDVS